jgi:hypothetical protein
MTRGRLLIVLASASLGLAPAAWADPDPFFGLQSTSRPSTTDVQRMAGGGAGTLRLTIDWWRVERQRGAYDWKAYDQLIGTASASKLTVLPTIMGTPAWTGVRKSGFQPTAPAARAAYLQFIRRLVDRYGPDACLRRVSGVSLRPIHSWQVWNEPNFPSYAAGGRPKARSYVSFLRLTRDAIKAEDPSARIVLAGLPDTKLGIPLMRYLKDLYAIRGARKLWDAVAIHPYARDAKGVQRVLTKVRRFIDSRGDRGKPLLVTELGWATAGPRSNFVTTAARQAELLRRSYELLSRERSRLGIGMVAWYSWRDIARPRGVRDWWGYHAGLFGLGGAAKPAWQRFTAAAGGSSGSGDLKKDGPLAPAAWSVMSSGATFSASAERAACS